VRRIVGRFLEGYFNGGTWWISRKMGYGPAEVCEANLRDCSATLSLSEAAMKWVRHRTLIYFFSIKRSLAEYLSTYLIMACCSGYNLQSEIDAEPHIRNHLVDGSDRIPTNRHLPLLKQRLNIDQQMVLNAGWEISVLYIAGHARASP
jgi:hypothetical protein